MRKLLLFITCFIMFMLLYECASCQSNLKWCEKDPEHPLCICEKQPTHPNCCCTPVELTYFTVKATGFTAELRWETASEENNDLFIIDRSPDAISWQTIGTIKGNGTTKEINTYSFLDENPESKNTYYRLTQIDLDGTNKMLGIQYIAFKWNVVDGFKVSGDVISYKYFDATGGITGNWQGFKILRVITKSEIYSFKVIK
jgi:hypothetical protein